VLTTDTALTGFGLGEPDLPFQLPASAADVQRVSGSLLSPVTGLVEGAVLAAALSCAYVPVWLGVSGGTLIFPRRNNPGTALRARRLHVSAPLGFIHISPKKLDV
jgi:hypothetical protein